MKYALKFDRPETTVVSTPEDIERLHAKMLDVDLLSIDTETTGLDIARDVVVFWSVATDLDSRYFLTVEQLRYFTDIFEDPRKAWVGSQMKYDANILANTGYPLAGDFFCTLTMDRLIDPGRDHGLKEAYEREFSERMKSFGEVFYPKNAKGQHRKPSGKEMYQILLERFEQDPAFVADYASMDAWSVLRLFYRDYQRLKRVTTWAGYTLWDVFLWVEVPMTRCLYNMERTGLPLDTQYLIDCIPDLEGRKTEIEKEIYKRAGRLLNLNSRQQLAQWLYEELGYDHLKLTPSGDKQLNKDAYKYLIEQGCTEAEMLQEYAKLGKLKGTYVDGLVNAVDPNNVLHTTFNQHKADTSRLTSSDPNLQNQMRDGTGVLNIRRAFIAGVGWVLIVGDYDQLEMYILGDYSGDPNLLHAITIGRDIHCTAVEIMFEEPYDEVLAAKKAENRDERQQYLYQCRVEVKAVEFGICYGKAAGSLARDLGYHKKVEQEHPEWDSRRVHTYASSMSQAKIDLFFDKNRGVKKFIDSTIRQAYRVGYVETKLGRRRQLSALMDYEVMLDHRLVAQKRGGKLCWCPACTASRGAERQAVNTKIQGTAADICGMAMIAIDHDPELYDIGYRQALQVHDEIVGRNPDSTKERATELVQWHMEHPGLKLNVPLRAEPHWADNWSEAKG